MVDTQWKGTEKKLVSQKINVQTCDTFMKNFVKVKSEIVVNIVSKIKYSRTALLKAMLSWIVKENREVMKRGTLNIKARHFLFVMCNMI
jgi:hypothetical protein